VPGGYAAGNWLAAGHGEKPAGSCAAKTKTQPAPAAATAATNAPSDTRLAARGWAVCEHGIYTRQAGRKTDAESEREAG
jgi:hypothetical protein